MWIFMITLNGCKSEKYGAARAAYNVIKDYLKDFKNIEYAVYCRPDDDSNYRTFERVFKGL